MDIANYIAKTPMSSKGFNGKLMYLTSGSLHIVGKNSSSIIPLFEIRELKMENRIVLLPVIAGGIVCPLSLMATFQGIGDPWFFMFLAIVALMGVYFGLTGQNSLVVKYSHHESIHFVNEFHSDLPLFCEFFNFFIRTNQLREGLFVNILNIGSSEGLYTFHGDETVFLGKDNIPEDLSEGHIYCVENPLYKSINLSVTGLKNGKLSAKIKGSIPYDALIPYI